MMLLLGSWCCVLEPACSYLIGLIAGLINPGRRLPVSSGVPNWKA